MTGARDRPAAPVDPTAWSGDEEAASYERGRPGYPPAAIDLLLEAAGAAPGALVVDVGAGTGKLTRRLCRKGLRVVAAEPMRGMRRRLRSVVPDAVAVGATAEALPLPDGCAHLVTAGQAFHWFDHERALQEAHRVLRPGGVVGLLWNHYDERVPWVAALSEVIDRYERLNPRPDTEAWRPVVASTPLFTFERHDVTHAQPTDAAQLRDRVASVSFVIRLAPEHRDAMLREVAALAPTDGTFELPYVTEVHVGRRRAA